MRGRLTLEKVNIAINEVASYADANAHLVTCPKRKVCFISFHLLAVIYVVFCMTGC
jgi:hypothetical protein